MADTETTSADPKMVTVTVLRGTVRTGGFDKELQEYHTEDHGPGDQVQVTEREAAGLIARGQVADPDADPVPVGQGPMFEAVADKPAAAAPTKRTSSKR